MTRRRTHTSVWGCDLRMNLVTMPYLRSVSPEIGPQDGPMAYEIIKPSLNFKPLAIPIYIELLYLLSTQTKDLRRLNPPLQ